MGFPKSTSYTNYKKWSSLNLNLTIPWSWCIQLHLTNLYRRTVASMHKMERMQEECAGKENRGDGLAEVFFTLNIIPNVAGMILWLLHDVAWNRRHLSTNSVAALRGLGPVCAAFTGQGDGPPRPNLSLLQRREPSPEMEALLPLLLLGESASQEIYLYGEEGGEKWHVNAPPGGLH